MAKFEYNQHADVSIARAKKARAIVYGVRGLSVLLICGVLLALIASTPPGFWIPTLFVIGFVTLVVTCICYGDDVYNRYCDYKETYLAAKRYGVADE